MPHRGRLNTLCNVVGKPVEQLMCEFQGAGVSDDFEGSVCPAVHSTCPYSILTLTLNLLLILILTQYLPGIHVWFYTILYDKLCRPQHTLLLNLTLTLSTVLILGMSQLRRCQVPLRHVLPTPHPLREGDPSLHDGQPLTSRSSQPSSRGQCAIHSSLQAHPIER